jgi:hypothetical protein
VTAFLVDEMFPPTAAVLLREKYGHDAVHACEAGLAGAEDIADFAAERDLVLLFVLKKNLPAGGAQPAALAAILDRWAREHPEPNSALTGRAQSLTEEDHGSSTGVTPRGSLRRRASEGREKAAIAMSGKLARPAGSPGQERCWPPGCWASTSNELTMSIPLSSKVIRDRRRRGSRLSALPPVLGAGTRCARREPSSGW